MSLNSLPVRLPAPDDPHGIGGTKSPEVEADESLRPYRVFADEHNRLLDSHVAVATEVGLTDGSTPGSLREADVHHVLKHAAFAGSSLGRLMRTGTGTYAVVKDNLAATVAPTSGDDFAADYAIGSEWIDTTAKHTYRCVGDGQWAQTDNTAGTPGLLTTVASTVALWNFDGNLLDSGPNGYALSGSPPYVYDGRAQKKAITTNTAIGTATTGSLLRITGSMTVEFVISNVTRIAGASIQWLISCDALMNRRYYLGFSGASNNWGLYWGFDDGTTYRDFGVPAPLGPGPFYVACTRSVSGGSSDMKTYINGVLAGSTTLAYVPSTTGANANTEIGSNVSPAEFLSSETLISQAHVCTAVLTAADIEARARALGLYGT